MKRRHRLPSSELGEDHGAGPPHPGAPGGKAIQTTLLRRTSVKGITLMSVRFTWDPRKAASNVRKHGVTFEEAASVFAHPLALSVEDALDHTRTLLVGVSTRMRIVVAVYAEVDEDTIRIISARRATSHERRHYEEGT